MELSLSVVRQAAHYRTTGKLSQCRAGFYAAVAQPADILILEQKAESLLPAQFLPINAIPTDGRFQDRPKIIAMTGIRVVSGRRSQNPVR